jgi:hypothetical protein
MQIDKTWLRLVIAFDDYHCAADLSLVPMQS